MSEEYSVPLSYIINEFNLEKVYMPEGAEDRLISNSHINRPSLQLAGFYDYFDVTRIQIMGKVELSYLETFDSEERVRKMDHLFSHDIPAVIITRDLEIPPEIVDTAKEHKTPVLRTGESTSSFISEMLSQLQVQLAPRITLHGVLVEVYGEGVLILGDSGVGKSETAMELVKRGHRLIADDAVEIKRVSSRSLVGSSPEIIRHFIELRGIGVVDVRRLFGMGAVKLTEKIDLVVNLEQWQEQKSYDRFGLESQYTEILGISIPSLTIPVKPGRNLAIILEVATMNDRQKKMGYDAAAELNHRLMERAGLV